MPTLKYCLGSSMYGRSKQQYFVTTLHSALVLGFSPSRETFSSVKPGTGCGPCVLCHVHDNDVKEDLALACGFVGMFAQPCAQHGRDR